MNETEVLTEANRLVAGGLRHAAIDLLQESLESNPDSPALLNALGRTYMLAGQSEQAVAYLQRSLEISQASRAGLRSSPSDQDDDFTEDDLAFINAQAEQQSEIDSPLYDLGSRGASQTGGLGATETPPRPILHLAPGNKGREAEKPAESELKVEFRSHPDFEPRDDPANPARGIEPQPPEGTGLAPDPCDSEPHPDTQPGSTEHSLPQSPPSVWHVLVLRQELSARFDQDPGFFLLGTASLQDIEPADEEPESESVDEPPAEPGPDAPELGLDEAEIYDEESGWLIESLAPTLDDEEAEELAWDDYDELDEFDEEAQREPPAPPDTEDPIPRDVRARQVAAEVVLECDWHPSTIDMLQEIFVESGWGAARAAIEREIAKGLLPEELALARAIRLYWSENEFLWTTYQRIWANAPLMEAKATYCQLSWPEALRIVRCFHGFPEVEEVIELIEDTYEWWYADGNLRRSFKTFLKFLKYRTGSMRGTLPGDCIFNFLEWPEIDSGTESIDFLQSSTPSRQYLQDLGIRLPLGGEPQLMIDRREPGE